MKINQNCLRNTLINIVLNIVGAVQVHINININIFLYSVGILFPFSVLISSILFFCWLWFIFVKCFWQFIKQNENRTKHNVINYLNIGENILYFHLAFMFQCVLTYKYRYCLFLVFFLNLFSRVFLAGYVMLQHIYKYMSL